MATKHDSYRVIQDKILGMKNTYPSLRTKSDDYVFSALCVKAHLYKNPALTLNDSDFEEIIVDGQYDGGVDVLVTDPNAEESDLIIAQSKFYTSISSDDVINAMTKMASFYKDMSEGHYEQVNAKVQRRFLTLNAEVGDESKIHFVFYTSAPQSGINRARIEKNFRGLFTDSSRFEISLFFGKDEVIHILPILLWPLCAAALLFRHCSTKFLNCISDFLSNFKMSFICFTF